MTQHNSTARASRRADGHFTMIANAAIRDPRLSWKAKGILAGALSHGPGFRFNREWFMRHATDGDSAVRTGMEELRQLGYLATERVIGPNGQFLPGGLHFSDDPSLIQQPEPSGGETDGGKTCGGKSTSGESDHIRKSIERTTKEEHQVEVEPPLPPAGGTHAQGALQRAVDEAWAQGEGMPEAEHLELAGTLGADPQPQHPAPQDHNAPSAPPSRMEPPEPSIPTHEHPEAPSWPLQAPLAAIASPPAKAPPKPRDRFASKVLSPDAIPDDLLDCQQLLPEWWSVKAKGRTEVAFNRACNLLRRFSPDERRQVLETAIIGGHQGLYEPREARPSGGKGWTPKQSATSQAFDEVSAFLDQLEAAR